MPRNFPRKSLISNQRKIQNQRIPPVTFFINKRLFFFKQTNEWANKKLNFIILRRHMCLFRLYLVNMRHSFCFAGFDREIPGFSRISVVGLEEEGVHNLRIRNVTLDDDGEYQCQVTPMLPSHAIRSSATLTVLRKSRLT